MASSKFDQTKNKTMLNFTAHNFVDKFLLHSRHPLFEVLWQVLVVQN